MCTIFEKVEGSPINTRWSPINLRMVTQRRKCTTDLEFGTYTLLTKLTPGENCYGWLPTILRMVTHQPKDGHPPEGSVLQTWNLAGPLYSKN